MTRSRTAQRSVPTPEKPALNCGQYPTTIIQSFEQVGLRLRAKDRSLRCPPRATEGGSSCESALGHVEKMRGSGLAAMVRRASKPAPTPYLPGGPGRACLGVFPEEL